MAEEIKFENWGIEFDKISESIKTAHSLVEKLGGWIWDKVVAKDVIPPEMPPEVSKLMFTLDQQLKAINQISNDLKWYFCQDPIYNWLNGHQLTKEQFYILAARGILKITPPFGRIDAYEEISNYYYYKDNESGGYINQNEPPDSLSVSKYTEEQIQGFGLRIGILPEDVKKSFLTPVQREYFSKYKPKLFSRFKDE